MFYKPLILNNLSLSFPHKTCFEDFSAQIHKENFIAIIGKNGSGKTSLLKMILKEANIQNITTSFVPQIPDFDNLSGAQRFHKALSQALAKSPEILLLDEPTNHLDIDNKKNLLYMLKNFHGNIIVISHDKELLRKANIIWHIDNGIIKTFFGNYDDYIHERDIELTKIDRELSKLEREKRNTHKSLMKEQKRATKSKEMGKKNIDNRRWPTICNKAKADRAATTTGKKKIAISSRIEEIRDRLSDLYVPEEIKPKFHIEPGIISYKNIVSISNGSAGYDEVILKDVNLSISGNEKIAIIGKNGSGKSTLLKAIMNDSIIKKGGDWNTPSPKYIGYLDQYYTLGLKGNSPFELIKEIRPEWEIQQIRSHLNDFLFRKNEEVNNELENLSGGERARLSLALIAANPPRLLILDEITNNLDLETKDHIAQILKEYPGAMIIVSHDEEFLDEVGIDRRMHL